MTRVIPLLWGAAAMRAASMWMFRRMQAHKWLQALLLLAGIACVPALVHAQRPAEQGSRYGSAQALTFTEFIGDRVADTSYRFGASAQIRAADNAYRIRNHLDLAALFNPLEDFTGATTINSELQVYAAAFNENDHPIGADHLGLRANLPGQEWTVRVGAQQDNRLGWALDGSAISWDRIPPMLLPYASEWRVGQFVALQNRGIYYLSDVQPGVSFTLTRLANSPNTGEFLFNLAAFLPIDSAQTAAPVDANATTLRFSPGALSPTIKVNHRVAITTDDTLVRNAADVMVTAIDHAAGSITLNRAMPLGPLTAGQRFVFYPRITAGQAWTKRQWDITQPRAFLAVEFDIHLFEGLSPDFESSGISGHTAFERANTAYPDAPFGAWPALWAYSADDGDRSKIKGTSEMDFMELWVSTNSGMKLFSSSNVGGKPAWARTDNGYSVSANGRNRVPYSMAGAHKVAVVYTNQNTYHYLDDRLIRIEEFRWASQAPIQIGMNMAMGSIATGFAANLNFPFRPENFQRARMDVKGLTVWHRAQ